MTSDGQLPVRSRGSDLQQLRQGKLLLPLEDTVRPLWTGHYNYAVHRLAFLHSLQRVDDHRLSRNDPVLLGDAASHPAPRAAGEYQCHDPQNLSSRMFCSVSP